MNLNFGILPDILFNPKATLKSIKGKVGMKEGILIFLILAALSYLIEFIMEVVAGIPIEIALIPGTSAFSIILEAVILIAISLFLFLLTIGWVAANLTRSLAKGKYDFDKTIGLLGYSSIVSFVMGILITLAIIFTGTFYDIEDVQDANLWGLVLLAGLSIVLVAWQLYVSGIAVSLANKVSTGMGIISIIVAVVLLIIVALGILILIASRSGYSIVGIVTLMIWLFVKHMKKRSMRK